MHELLSPRPLHQKIFQKYLGLAYTTSVLPVSVFCIRSNKLFLSSSDKIADSSWFFNLKEIIFTSGATESNNLCLKGVAQFYGDKKKHIITTTIDHKCVLDSCRRLEDEGFEVTYLPVGKITGLVDPEDLKAALRPDTLMASIIHVHNEIGVI